MRFVAGGWVTYKVELQEQEMSQEPGGGRGKLLDDGTRLRAEGFVPGARKQEAARMMNLSASPISTTSEGGLGHGVIGPHVPGMEVHD